MDPERQIRCSRCQVVNDLDVECCARCGAILFEPGYVRRRRRRRVTPEGAVLSLLMLAALAVATLVIATIIDRTLHPAERVDPFAGRSGTTASTTTTVPSGSTGEAPSKPVEPPPVHVRPVAATASSSVEPTRTVNFRATNLLDNDLTTAWIEGVEGTGLGEWVEFEFGSPVVLARIDILNGHQKDNARFKGGIRIRALAIEYSDGGTQLVELLDTRDIQSINTLRAEIEWIRLTVVSVYPDFVWEDAALSEVRMYKLVDQE